MVKLMCCTKFPSFGGVGVVNSTFVKPIQAAETRAENCADFVLSANHRTNTAYKAQTLLYLLRGYEFPVEIPNIEGGSMAYTVFKTGYNNSKSKFGTFIPNPSSGTTSLQYYLVDDTSTAILQIYDLKGHCVTSATLKNSGNYVLDAILPTGIYMYTISVQGNIVERNKLAIIK